MACVPFVSSLSLSLCVWEEPMIEQASFGPNNHEVWGVPKSHDGRAELLDMHAWKKKRRRKAVRWGIHE